MSNVELKNVPHVTLVALIKRRKTTLKQFVQDAGVQSYAGLKTLCQRLGVEPVTEDAYDKMNVKGVVTSQQDGIVVLGPVDQVFVENETIPEKKSKKARKFRNVKTNEQDHRSDDPITDDDA